MITLEDVGDCATDFRILVATPQARPVVEVGTPREIQAIQKLRSRVLFSQGVNQRRLLPIAQELEADTQVFF